MAVRGGPPEPHRPLRGAPVHEAAIAASPADGDAGVARFALSLQLWRRGRHGELRLAARKSELHPPVVAAMGAAEVGDWDPLTQAIQAAKS